MAELTLRQRLFVAEYLKDLNAKHAAVRTGYSGKSRANGNCLMANEAVRAEIERALAPRLPEMETSAEWVLVAIADIAFGDVRDVFDDEGPLKTSRAISLTFRRPATEAGFRRAHPDGKAR
ncbi:MULTISPECIES: terminase small subunit [Rhizobium]|uniref:Phage terminase small subunit n=1 Tax=Rhizobium esperanzae TaxID=1967781 RepID=A0A7W6XXW2_9HYPH|nr:MULTISPECIES: terminase small subunit [Rhizobium]MBB4440345.1 phage terminase small subunit [Rhizobium esperanzae]MDH6202989.1 phage terminase small subunit [Rhizobium leguminosarum]